MQVALSPYSSMSVVDWGMIFSHSKRAFPNYLENLIVQDLPVVIDDVKDLPVGIEVMKHDLFTPQPVRNARAYYLRTALHGWPNK